MPEIEKDREERSHTHIQTSKNACLIKFERSVFELTNAPTKWSRQFNTEVCNSNQRHAVIFTRHNFKSIYKRNTSSGNLSDQRFLWSIQLAAKAVNHYSIGARRNGNNLIVEV